MSSIPFRSRRSLNTNQSVISNDSCAHDKNISSPSLINAKDSDGIMVQENPQKSNLLENNSSLFVKLLPSSVNPEKLAEEWIESYLSNSKNGTTDFIQLLISGSGCQAKISNNDLFSVSFDTILLNLAESFSSCVHPLVNGTKAYRYFNVNMKKFLYSVFEKIRHQVLSDGLFLSKLVNCLLPMCSSSIRPFRYTGTFVAMKLQSALLQMELSINQIINDLQVQCSGRLGLRSSSSASFCKDQINNQTKSIRIISKLEEELLIEVFDHRSRDVASNIRQLCLEELGHWLNINPQKFSQKKFIKYFVDFLHDKTNDTTLHCLRMLASLIDANNLDIVVSVFSTCKSRVHQLICDKDSSISSEIIRICSEMLRLGKDVVGESKFIHYCLFAYDSKRAYAAGQFFIVDLIRRATLLEIVRDDRNYLKLCTVRFFELGIQNHATYFIDSMFNHHSMFTNFDAMIDLLLCDNVWTDLSLLIDNIHEEELQLLLIHIITCSIHRAVTGNTPSGRTIQQSSQKNSKITEDLRDQFTKAFTKHISEIMTTYLCEESKVVELLSLIPLMNVNEFQSYIEEHQFNIVIDKCKTLAERTINSEALSKVSAALEWLSNSHLKHCDNTNAVVNNVLDELTVEFNHYFKLMKTDDKDCNDENVRQSCAVALMKITIFNRNHAYMKYDFWRKLITLMKSNSNITILTYSIELSILRMFWMAHICTDTMNSTSIDENTINFCSKLLACSKQLCEVLFQLMAANPNADICFLAYRAICKLMCWLNAGLNGDRFAKIALFDISGQANSPVVKLMEFAENTILSDQQFTMTQRRESVSCFIKLILKRVIPLKCYATILKHFVKANAHFGDILRASITMLRENFSRNDVAKLLGQALCQKDKDVFLHGEKANDTEIKELIKRIRMLMGVDQLKRHDEIIAFQNVCLQYAIMNQRSQLFDIVSEFSGKISDTDKSSLYKMFCRRHSSVDRELCQQNYVDREPIVSTIDIIQHEAGNTSQHLQSVCQSFESNASSNLTVVPADKFNIDAISTFTPLHECRINAPLASSTIDRPQQLTVGKNFAYTNKQFIDTIDEEELSLIENADQRRCAIPKDGPISSNFN